MCRRIFSPAQTNVYLLCALCHINISFYLIWFDCCDSVRNYSSPGHTEAGVLCCPRPSVTKSMLIWRTQGLCEELCRWKYPHADKRTVNATLHNISKVELLLLTPNCPTCLGDTQMSSRDTKNLHPLFCIILSFARRQGGAGVREPSSVSKSFCLSFKWQPCSIIHEGPGVMC